MHACHSKCGKNIFAKLKKRKKPNTSVAVVRKMEEEIAGSRSHFFKANGIKNPKKPAMMRFPIMAIRMISPKKKLSDLK